MTEAKKRFFVGFVALAAAGVIGGVTAVSLFGGPQQPAQQVRTVSDEASAAPTTSAVTPPPAVEATASPTTAVSSPAADGTPAAKTPAATRAANSRTTETEPANPPAPAEAGDPEPGVVPPPPTTGPPPPPEPVPCLPQEIGMNPRCPATN